MNSFKVGLLMIILVAILMAIGYMVGGHGGMVGAFLIAAVLNLVTYWKSDSLILRLYRGRRITERDHPLLYQTVARVANLAMLPMPRVYIVPKRAPNAFATGRNEHHAAIAVTEGLLQLLSEKELTAVIGHEMAHIKNNDMLLGTVVATFAGAIGMLAFVARWGAFIGGIDRSDDRQGGFIGLLAIAIVAPLVALIIRTAISRQREYKADADGAEITRNYENLATALIKLHRSPVQLRLDRKPGVANLMIANPLSGKGISSLFSTHPPVEKRVERLKEQALQSPYD